MTRAACFAMKESNPLGQSTSRLERRGLCVIYGATRAAVRSSAHGNLYYIAECRV